MRGRCRSDLLVLPGRKAALDHAKYVPKSA
jgi:hypothetical protein